MTSKRQKFANGETIEFDAAHYRVGEIETVGKDDWAVGQPCHVCDETSSRFVFVNPSEGEYAGGLICAECIRAWLSEGGDADGE